MYNECISYTFTNVYYSPPVSPDTTEIHTTSHTIYEPPITSLPLKWTQSITVLNSHILYIILFVLQYFIISSS